MTNANPKIDRDYSGVVIRDILRPPGTYQVSPGTQVTIKARVRNIGDYGRVKVEFVINNTPTYIIRTFNPGSSAGYEWPVTINDYTKIYIRTYYVTAEGLEVKTDEYGPWEITVGEMPTGQAKPVFDRSKSGLRRATGGILPPGSYDFKVGDTYYVDCVVTSETEGLIKTVVVINGKIVQSWEDEISAGGTVSHTYTGTFDRPSSEVGTYEISIATYYWDGSQYVKNDEYGVWRITAIEQLILVSQARPVFDRANSGIRIAGGSLLSPGSYKAKVGDSYEVTCVVTSETEGLIKTVVLINGSIVQFWQEEIAAGGSVFHTYTGTFDKEGTYEITMATYYWDGSQYVLNDEYGCGD